MDLQAEGSNMRVVFKLEKASADSVRLPAISCVPGSGIVDFLSSAFNTIIGHR